MVCIQCTFSKFASFSTYYQMLAIVLSVCSADSPASKINQGALVGGAIGGVVILIIIILITGFVFWKLS